MAVQRTARCHRRGLCDFQGSILDPSEAVSFRSSVVRECNFACLFCFVSLFCVPVPIAAPMSRNSDPDGGAEDCSGTSYAHILERLFRSEGPGLVRFVRSRIGRDEEVQDVVQEAFACLAAARSQVLLERPEAYLQRIARNLLFTRYRRAAARQASRHVTIDHALDVAIPPDQAWAIEADDARQRYLAAIDALSPRTREIFLRSRVDGRTYSEIAQEMSVSVKAIEYHMGRALAHLYQAFYGE